MAAMSSPEAPLLMASRNSRMKLTLSGRYPAPSMRRRLLGGGAIVALIALVAGLMGPAARAQSTDRDVAPGIEFQAFTRQDPVIGPQEVRVLRFHLDDAHVHLRPVLAADYGARVVTVPDLVL